MTTEYVLLSFAIDERTPLYGTTPPPVIKEYSNISKGASSSSFVIHIHNHTGTHADAPGHFIPGGRSISDYSMEELIYNMPLLVECPAEVGGNIPLKKTVSGLDVMVDIDCMLLKTGFGKHRNERIYSTHNPWVASEDILWLRREFPSIRCLGVDSLSISGFQNREEGRKAHRAAFIPMDGGGQPLLLIEDMNLASISSQTLKKIIVIPWQIKGIDSAPCSVLAEVEVRNNLAGRDYSIS